MSALPPLSRQVRDEWIDYNGHLSEAYYVLLFGFATDAVMDRIGLDETYLQTSGSSLYTVEAHVRYLREVNAGAQVEIISRIVEYGGKKVRLCHEMNVGDVLVATEEVLAVHVNSTEGRASPLPEETTDRLAALVEPVPDYAGRSLG